MDEDTLGNRESPETMTRIVALIRLEPIRPPGAEFATEATPLMIFVVGTKQSFVVLRTEMVQNFLVVHKRAIATTPIRHDDNVLLVGSFLQQRSDE